MIRIIRKNLKELNNYLKKRATIQLSPRVEYRLVQLRQKPGETYNALIQCINRNVVFEMKPEEILLQDDLVDRFSQRDIRTLVYLGYLDINSPTYRILEKKISENSDRFIFTLKKQGEKRLSKKTAHEIFFDSNIFHNLSSEDSNVVSYVVATESLLDEKDKMKKIILNEEIENES